MSSSADIKSSITIHAQGAFMASAGPTYKYKYSVKSASNVNFCFLTTELTFLLTYNFGDARESLSIVFARFISIVFTTKDFAVQM